MCCKKGGGGGLIRGLLKTFATWVHPKESGLYSSSGVLGAADQLFLTDSEPIYRQRVFLLVPFIQSYELDSFFKYSVSEQSHAKYKIHGAAIASFASCSGRRWR